MSRSSAQCSYILLRLYQVWLSIWWLAILNEGFRKFPYSFRVSARITTSNRRLSLPFSSLLFIGHRHPVDATYVYRRSINWEQEGTNYRTPVKSISRYFNLLCRWCRVVHKLCGVTQLVTRFHASVEPVGLPPSSRRHLSLLNSVYAVTLCVSTIHFSIVLWVMFLSLEWSLPLTFSD